MADPIDIVVITGFLGSGKTTFLNSLLQELPHGRRIAVLMNEFGEIGIDGALLRGDNYELVEISRGSIFCICVKTDYIKAMHRIAHELRPDLLVIETTGVANPADMGRDLQLGIFKDKFALLDQVCIIDPTSFPDLFDIYTSIEKQVTSSKLFVVNKTDIASRDAIERSKDLIRNHNPRAKFFETTFCQVPVHEIWPAMSKPGATANAQPPPGPAVGGEELDDILEEIFSDRSREFTPPDNVLSEVLVWKGASHSDFLKAVQDLPTCVLRSKGFLKFDDEVRLFNRTMHQMNIEDIEDVLVPDIFVNKLVVIYPYDKTAAMDDYLHRQNLFQRLPGSLKDNRLIPLGTVFSQKM
jgi:G3E family GTPase